MKTFFFLSPTFDKFKTDFLLTTGEEGGRAFLQLLAAILVQEEAHIQLLQTGEVGLRAVKQSHSRSSFTTVPDFFINDFHCLSSVWGFPFSEYVDLERLKKCNSWILLHILQLLLPSFSLMVYCSYFPFKVFTYIAAFCHCFILFFSCHFHIF